MSSTARRGSPKGNTGQRRPPGAPRGNRNALRHGMRGSKLPKDARYIEHQLNRLRRELEQRVVELRGEVTLADAASIQTAVRWERHAALAARWLRTEGDNLKPADRLAFSREIARASSERDKALVALKLDRNPLTADIDALYAPAKEGGSDEPN